MCIRDSYYLYPSQADIMLIFLSPIKACRTNDQESLLTVQCPMFTNDENCKKKWNTAKLRFNRHANYAKNKSEYKHINRKKDTIGTLLKKLETWPSVLQCNCSVQGRKKKKEERGSPSKYVFFVYRKWSNKRPLSYRGLPSIKCPWYGVKFEIDAPL